MRVVDLELVRFETKAAKDPRAAAEPAVRDEVAVISANRTEKVAPRGRSRRCTRNDPRIHGPRLCVDNRKLLRHLAGISVEAHLELEQTALRLIKLSTKELPLVGTGSLEPSKYS